MTGKNLASIDVVSNEDKHKSGLETTEQAKSETLNNTAAKTNLEPQKVQKNTAEP